MRGTGRYIPGLGRVRIYLLLAHLFAIFTLASYGLTLVFYLVTPWFLVVVPGVGPIVLLLLVPAAPTIFVVLWVERMRRVLRYGHYVRLVKLNSLAVAILALLFSGVVAGVFLLLVRRRLPRPPKEKRPPKIPDDLID